MIYNKPSINKKRKELYSKKKRLHSSFSVVTIRIVLLILAALLVGGCGLVYGSVRGMLASTPEEYDLKPKYSATIIYDDSGKTVQQLSDYSSNRIIVKYSQLQENLKNAFISIEDERFYEHNGIDLRGIARALINDIKTGSTAQGASTITQQLIKNNVFDVGGESNFMARVQRKIQEQYLAIEVEKSTSKEEIITDYLNTINLGKGTLGVEAAAKYYFNKSVEELTLSECAVLAGITKNPTNLNPIDHPDENNTRRKMILKKMCDLNFISSDEYQASLDDDVYTRIAENNATHNQNSVYSYFTDAVITKIVDDLQSRLGYTQTQAYNLVYRGGLRIHTTQDSDLQTIADKTINDEKNYPIDTDYSLEYTLQVSHADGSSDTYTEADLKSYFRNVKGKSSYKTIYPTKKELKKACRKFRKYIVKDSDTILVEKQNYSMEPQVSFSLIDQSNGEVKVLVGGRGQKHDDLALNRATAVKRQPGSTFKTLSTYAPALDTGGMTLATSFDDAPYTYENGDRVTNYEKDSYKGLTTIRDAIIDSNNIIAVKALTKITPKVGFNFLEKLGFTTLVNNRVNTNGAIETDVNQPLSLGGITDGVTNLELTAAYACLANKGYYNSPVLYTTVEDANGNTLLENKTNTSQVMKESTAWLLTNAMEDVVKKGTGTEAQLSTKMGVAGKTGTTSNNYDYWFCGYTPYYTASIWTGYDYNTSFDNDDDYHKVIWAKIMDKVNKKKKLAIKDFDSCSDIETATICAKSGKLAIKNVCSNDQEKNMERVEYFAKGTAPTESCDSHIAVTFCSKSNRVARKYCPDKFKKTKIFRIRPENASGTTDDSRYCLHFDLDTYKCDIHTKKWYERKQAKQAAKQQQQQQQEQQNQQNNSSDPNNSSGNSALDNLENNIKKIFQ